MLAICYYTDGRKKKNIVCSGVLIARVCVCVCTLSHLVVSNSSRPHGLQPFKPLCHWNFTGKNTGVGFHFLLQGIFLTQGLNLSLASSALAGGFLIPSDTWEALLSKQSVIIFFFLIPESLQSPKFYPQSFLPLVKHHPLQAKLPKVSKLIRQIYLGPLTSE